MFTNVLVPLDGSELAEKALEKAQEIAVNTGAAIHLVHVISHRPELEARHGDAGFGGISLAEFQMEQARDLVRKQMDRGGEYLKQVADRLKSGGVQNVTATVLEGDVSEQIQQYAEDNNIDLIVITSRGHGGIKRLVLGSVTDYLVRSGTAPVLVWPSN